MATYTSLLVEETESEKLGGAMVWCMMMVYDEKVDEKAGELCIRAKKRSTAVLQPLLTLNLIL